MKTQGDEENVEAALRTLQEQHGLVRRAHLNILMLMQESNVQIER